MALPYEQYITLKFSSMESLWQFQKLAGLRNFHFDSRDCTLSAQLSEIQLELAIALKILKQPEQKTGLTIG